MYASLLIDTSIDTGDVAARGDKSFSAMLLRDLPSQILILKLQCGIYDLDIWKVICGVLGSFRKHCLARRLVVEVQQCWVQFIVCPNRSWAVQDSETILHKVAMSYDCICYGRVR